MDTPKRRMFNQTYSKAAAETFGDGASSRLVATVQTEINHGPPTTFQFYYGKCEEGICDVLWISERRTSESADREAVAWALEPLNSRIPWLELLGCYWDGEREEGNSHCLRKWEYCNDMISPSPSR